MSRETCMNCGLLFDACGCGHCDECGITCECCGDCECCRVCCECNEIDDEAEHDQGLDPKEKTIWKITYSSLIFSTFEEAHEQAMKLWALLKATNADTEVGLEPSPELGHYILGDEDITTSPPDPALS
jgi:hypothetical protein